MRYELTLPPSYPANQCDSKLSAGGRMALRAGFLFVLMVAFSPTPCFADECHFRYLQYTFDFGRSKILTEVYQPEGHGKFPLVFMIHGSAGVYTHSGASVPEKDNFGEKQLAANCFAVALVHYFDAAGIASTQDVDFLKSHSSLWMNCLITGLEFVSKLPYVDDSQIGFLGESMGGFLAVELVSATKVRAVSVISAGLFPMRLELRKPLPELQIQHGKDDFVVPISQAVELRDLWKANGGSVEFRLYEGGHYLNAPARQLLMSHVVNFFKRALQQKEHEAK